MIVIATSDPGFAVEENYYQKATQWDQQMVQNEANRRLGWRAQVSFEPDADSALPALVVKLEDAAQAPLTGALVQVEAFHNARAAKASKLELKEVSAGTYRAPLLRQRSGLWEVRMIALKGAERYTQTSRIDMAASWGAGAK